MKKSTLWLRGLHVALGLSLPFVLAFLMGCKRAKEEKGELGPEASAQAVEAAINAAVSGRTLSTLKMGQFVEYSNVRRIENQEGTYTLGSLHVKVLSAEENTAKTETKYIFEITRTSRTSSGSFDTKITETDPWIVPKDPPPSTTSFGANKIAEIRNDMAKVRQMARERAIAKASAGAKTMPVTPMAEEGEPSATFHNLRVSDGVVAAPGGVASKPGCGGLPNCEMHVRYVRFDIVDWYSATDYQKVSIDFAFSLEPPYLPISREFFDLLNGILVTDCRSTTVPIEERKVYVRDCKQLENYQK